MIDRNKPGIKLLPKSVHYDLQMIYLHFGERNQLEKLHEEIDEFLNATSPENYIEELSDIIVVGLEILLSDEDVQQIVYDKIKRTTERIRTGYPGYEKPEKNKKLN